MPKGRVSRRKAKPNQSTEGRLRIAMVSDSVLPTPVDGWGGLERVIYDLTEELTRRGHDVTLFGAQGSYCSARVITTIPAGLGWNGEPEHCRIVEQYLSAEKFDVIHDHTHLHSLSKSHPDWPIINHHQDDNDIADINVVTSSYALRYKYAMTHAKVVYNGVDTAFWSGDVASARGDYILYMGVVLQRKGADIAARAAIMSGVPLIIAGKTEWDEKFFNETLRPMIDGSLIRFVGAVEGEAKRELLRNARALVLLSRHCEPGALTPLEAQALGVPCIVSPNGCLPEYVEHGFAGYVCQSVPEVASAARAVDGLDRNEIARRARAEFSIARMADNMEVLYRLRARGHQWVGSRTPTRGAMLGGQPKDICVILSGQKPREVARSLQSLVDSTYMGWYAICNSQAIEDEAPTDPRVILVDSDESIPAVSRDGRFIMYLEAGQELLRRELVLLVRGASQHRAAAGLTCREDKSIILWRQPGPKTLTGDVVLLEYQD